MPASLMVGGRFFHNDGARQKRTAEILLEVVPQHIQLMLISGCNNKRVGRTFLAVVSTASSQRMFRVGTGTVCGFGGIQT